MIVNLNIAAVPSPSTFRNISPAAFKAYAFLAISLNTLGEVALPIAIIADATNLSYRAVSRALAELRTHGLLLPAGQHNFANTRIPRYRIPLQNKILNDLVDTMQTVINQRCAKPAPKPKSPPRPQTTPSHLATPPVPTPKNAHAQPATP